MTLEDFIATTDQKRPPRGLAPALLALWHDRRGDWEAAHDVAQDIDDPDGAWIHAFLHRKEKDLANAGYWYRRASRPVATGSFDEEWTAIATAMLTATP